jgi:AAA domain, putative AbiEii toxin, Type IV TA system/AAA ATPase domain
MGSMRQSRAIDLTRRFRLSVEMELKSVRLRNYMGHRDTGELQIGSRFTVFVGQNNSGKSSLLQALTPSSFSDRPHKLPQTGTLPPVLDPTSTITFKLTFSGSELEHQVLATAGRMAIPISAIPSDTDGIQFAKDWVSRLLAEAKISFEFTRNGNSTLSAPYPSHRQFDVDSAANRRCAIILVGADRQDWAVDSVGGDGDDLPGFWNNIYQQNAYGFKAERMNIGACQISESPVLSSDASNLASVLLQMSTLPDQNRKYVEFLQQIFPTIYHVGSRPISNNRAQVEIIMNYDADGKPRGGISVALSDCGTGVSQVLALLYVVVTAQSRRVIVIDEPNSFLHPGAAKKLISILKRFEHQYIISTHSAELIRVIDPDVLHLIGWKETASTFETVDRKSIQHQRKILADLGVSLSDVFGADQILWVEGPTEERCFPLLLEHINLLSPSISIASLVAVDDLRGKSRKAKLSWDIYQKLSNAGVLIPSALAFSFDNDDRSEQEIADMVRESKGLANFLPRRMYENYVLHPRAIADLLSKCLGRTISEEQILKGLNSRQPNWQESSIDAAKLLADIFTDLSDAKLEFRKTEHSLALTNFILKNDSDHFSELFDYLRKLINSPSS